MGDNSYSIVFSLSLIAPVGGFFFMLCWIFYFRHGFSYSDNDWPFNFHPFFMSLAYLLFLGEGIVVWGHRYQNRNVLKAIHAFLNGISLLFIILGLVFAFKYHNDRHIPNMLSLHSWVGIITVLITFLQWCVSFVVFVWPGGSDYVRVSLKTYHRYFGYIVFILATTTMLLGLLEKITLLSLNAPYILSPDHTFGNITGLVILFASFFIFLQLYNKPPER